ncbi:MAG: hydrogenase maturation nickel metallochaperone HypA [Phycisphaerales bacterium]|nr:hydrogenase maturation nickel metallochaperone HypA [Phycisphaerales bacterium]
MGVVKSITVGAVRFIAEVVAWSFVVALLFYANTALASGSPRLLATLELIICVGIAATGNVAGRALKIDARGFSANGRPTWKAHLCSSAMTISVFVLLQGVPDIVREIITLVLQARPQRSIWSTVIFGPTLIAVVIAGGWWTRRICEPRGCEFLYLWARWTLAVGVALVAIGAVVGVVLLRSPNPEIRTLVSPGLIHALPAIIATASAIRVLRRAARDSLLARSGRCRSCGYDMSTLDDAAICPECGRPRQTLEAAG